MKRCVLKFLLPSVNEQIQIQMPLGSLPISAGIIGNRIYVWAIVDPDTEQMGTFLFWVAETGRPIPSNWHQHLGTCLLYDGAYVLHVFWI